MATVKFQRNFYILYPIAALVGSVPIDVCEVHSLTSRLRSPTTCYIIPISLRLFTIVSEVEKC